MTSESTEDKLLELAKSFGHPHKFKDICKEFPNVKRSDLAIAVISLCEDGWLISGSDGIRPSFGCEGE